MNEFLPLKIGEVKTKNNLFLAPLAGYTDVAFRHLAIEYGAGLTVSEMVSAKGLCYNANAAKELLLTAENESPLCVQLFGSEPEFFERAIALPELSKFNIIDINMGCPVKKITSNGEGSALMKKPLQAAAVIKAAVKTAKKLGKAVTAKIRLGQNDENINASEIALIAQSEGADAVTVHGRTVKQLYSGLADWESIGNIARSLSIPVIGNGDIKSRTEAAQKIRDFGVKGVMVGRGAIGNPSIFSDNINTNTLQILFKHLDYMLLYFGQRYTVINIRKHLPYYLKGIKGIKAYKNELNSFNDITLLKSRLKEIFKEVQT